MPRFSTVSSPSQILILIHRCARFYRCAHICRSHLSRSHMCTPSTKAHFVNRIARYLQVHMCTLRSHVYASFRDGSTHAVHTCIPFSQMQTLLTSSHPFSTHTRSSTVQMCTSRYTMKDIGSITFECVRSVRKVNDI